MVTGYTGGDDGNTPIKRKSIRSRYSKPSEKTVYNGDIKSFEKDQLRVDQDIWLPPVSGDTLNYNIVGDNPIKKVFKIEVGNIPDEEIEDYIKKVVEKFKKATQIQPNLDYGIPLNDFIYPDENELFLPTNIEKKMPEQPDYQKIHDALYPKGSSAHYMHVIPNTHFWTDLDQIVHSIQYELDRQKHEEGELKDSYIVEPLTAEYIVIGLKNSIERGYNLKQDKNVKLNPSDFIIFASIEQMIVYAQSERFNLEAFSNIISNTINVGFNLTNGLKMERKEVYERIDTERKYQDLAWGNDGHPKSDVPDEEKPVAEWLNYIEYHLSKAKNYNYHSKKDHSLEELRKVAALAVRAMEIHGCPERRMPNRIGNTIINPDGTTCKCGDCDCKK